MDLKTVLDGLFLTSPIERYQKSRPDTSRTVRTKAINEEMGIYDKTEDYMIRDKIMPIIINNGLVTVPNSSSADKEVAKVNCEPLVLSTARRCPFLFSLDMQVSPLTEYTDEFCLESTAFKTSVANSVRDGTTSTVFGGAMLEAMLEQLKNINPVYEETEWAQKLPRLAREYMKEVFKPMVRRYYADISTSVQPIITPLRALFSKIRYEGIAAIPPAKMQAVDADRFCENKWRDVSLMNQVEGYVYGRGGTVEIPSTTGVYNEFEVDYNSTINFNVALGSKRQKSLVLRKECPLGADMPSEDPPVTVYFCVAPNNEVFTHPESGVMDSADPLILGKTMKDNSKDLIPEFVSSPNNVMKHREIRGRSGIVFNSVNGKMLFGNIYSMFSMGPQQEKLFMGEHYLGPDTDYTEFCLSHDQSATWLLFFAPCGTSKLDVLETLAQTCIENTRCGSVTNKPSLRSVGAMAIGTVSSSKGHSIYDDPVTNCRKLKLCNLSSAGKIEDKMEFMDFFYLPINKDIDEGSSSRMILSKMETSNDTGYRDDPNRRTILSDITEENIKFLPDYYDPLHTKEDKTREIMSQYTINTLRTALHYDKVLGMLKQNITKADIVEAAGRVGSLGLCNKLSGWDLSQIPKAFGGHLSSGCASTSARKRAVEEKSQWLHGDPLYKRRRINTSGQFEDVQDDELELTIQEKRDADLAELIQGTWLTTTMGSFNRDCQHESDGKIRWVKDLQAVDDLIFKLYVAPTLNKESLYDDVDEEEEDDRERRRSYRIIRNRRRGSSGSFSTDSSEEGGKERKMGNNDYNDSNDDNGSGNSNDDGSSQDNYDYDRNNNGAGNIFSRLDLQKALKHMRSFYDETFPMTRVAPQRNQYSSNNTPTIDSLFYNAKEDKTKDISGSRPSSECQMHVFDIDAIVKKLTKRSEDDDDYLYYRQLAIDVLDGWEKSIINETDETIDNENNNEKLFIMNIVEGFKNNTLPTILTDKGYKPGFTSRKLPCPLPSNHFEKI